MLKVGIIGCGNAGNQVCALCAKKYPDIPVVAINCSEKDMQTLPNTIRKVSIGDGKGAGKNRDEAKNFLQNSIMEFLSDEDIKKFLTSLDIVFIVSSTGGGTGSGISLLLNNIIRNVYEDSEYPVFPISVGVLPTISEALSTQANSLGYLTDLYEVLDQPTYMLYDNDRFAKLSAVDTLRTVNERIVEDINVLRGYYNGPTTVNSIDERDAMTLITAPGRLVVASLFDVKEKDCDDTATLEDKLIAELNRNAHAEIQLDGIVYGTGVISNLSKEMLSKFDTRVKKIQETVGCPVEEFEHTVVNEDRKLPNNVFYIASGLSDVNDRIIKIKDRIAEITEAQRKKADDTELDKDVLKAINAKRVYRTSPTAEKPEQKTAVDIAGIFNKFKH